MKSMIYKTLVMVVLATMISSCGPVGATIKGIAKVTRYVEKITRRSTVEAEKVGKKSTPAVVSGGKMIKSQTSKSSVSQTGVCDFCEGSGYFNGHVCMRCGGSGRK